VLVHSLKTRYGDSLVLAPTPKIRFCCATLDISVARLVASFLEGAALFGLSRMWYDLIAAYMLELQPVPFCGTAYHTDPCHPPADALSQTIFALVAIVVTGLLKHLAEYYKLSRLGGMWDDVPQISNYFAGWAFANALTQAVIELKASYPILCEAGSFTTAGDCIGFDLAFAVVLTVGLGLLIIMIQPFAEKIECGSGCLIDWIEDLLADMVAMVRRGCSVVIMVWWYNTLYNTEFLNVPGDGSWYLKLEVQILYTLALTYLSTILSTRLEAGEIVLSETGTCCGCKCGTIKYDEVGELRRDEDGEPILPVMIKSLKGLSDMVQTALSFVVGCAWSDIVALLFLSLGLAPSALVLAQNLGVTVGLTLLVSFFIVRTGKAYELTNAASREATEAFLLINGAAFFVGWTWLVVIRDLHAQYNRLCEEQLEPWAEAKVAEYKLISYLSDDFDYIRATNNFAVLSFSIVLTALMFAASACVFSALETAEAEQEEKERAIHDKRVALQEKGASKELV